MKRYVFLLLSILVLALAACGGAASAVEETASAVTTGATGVATTDTSSPAAASLQSAPAADDQQSAAIAAAIANAKPVDTLSADYRDALSVETQLALGIVQLEGSDLAVTEEQAGQMLVLWQTLQTLQSSGTAADVELQAVVNQIQTTMTPEQLGAISAMALTEDSATALMQSGGLGFFGGRQAGGQGSADGTAPQGGGGGRFAGGGQFDGGPGAGGPGGGAGGGFAGGPGGIGGDPSQLATRQAEFAASGGSIIEQFAPNMVIRLLENKTGQSQDRGFGGFGAAITAVSEATGMDADAVQAALAEGQTLREIVEANGGDATAVREAIITALGDNPQSAQQDLGAMADELLDSNPQQRFAPPQN